MTTVQGLRPFESSLSSTCSLRSQGPHLGEQRGPWCVGTGPSRIDLIRHSCCLHNTRAPEDRSCSRTFRSCIAGRERNPCRTCRSFRCSYWCPRKRRRNWSGPWGTSRRRAAAHCHRVLGRQQQSFQWTMERRSPLPCPFAEHPFHLRCSRCKRGENFQAKQKRTAKRHVERASRTRAYCKHRSLYMLSFIRSVRGRTHGFAVRVSLDQFV